MFITIFTYNIKLKLRKYINKCNKYLYVYIILSITPLLENL